MIVFIIFLPKFNNINYLKLLFLVCGFIKFLMCFYLFIKKKLNGDRSKGLYKEF